MGRSIVRATPAHAPHGVRTRAPRDHHGHAFRRRAGIGHVLAVAALMSALAPDSGAAAGPDAAALPSAGAGAQLRCFTILGQRLEHREDGSAPGRYACRMRDSGPCTTHVVRGASSAHFGDRDAVIHVEASSDTTITPCEGLPGGHAGAVLSANAGFWVRVELVSPPPADIGLDLPVLVSGALSSLSEGNAGHGGGVWLNGPGVSRLWALSAGNEADQSFAETIDFRPGHAYGVSIVATCLAQTAVSDALSSRCAATADPAFAFDQAAFDAAMGEDTFALADHFVIRYSDNLVPTPDGITLAMATGGRTLRGPFDPAVPRVAATDPVTWTYEIANMGETAIAADDLVLVTDDAAVAPTLDAATDDGDLVLSPREVWTYSASAAALDLDTPPAGIAVVPGCGDGRLTRETTARAAVAGTGTIAEDVGWYCNDEATRHLVLFDVAAGMVAADFARVLDQIAAMIVANAEPVRIEGHTDSIGTDTYNLALGLRRADAVAAYLAAKGVPATLMTTTSYGETRPLAPNANADGTDNPEGRALNRRVEIRR